MLCGGRVSVFLTLLLACSWISFNPSKCLQETQFLAGSPVCHNDTAAAPVGSGSSGGGGGGAGSGGSGGSVPSGCVKRLPSSQSWGQCMNSCVLDAQCVGVTVDSVDKDFCVVHYDCSRDLVCSPSPSPGGNNNNNNDNNNNNNNNPLRRFYSKNCAHDGRWMPSDGKCRCVDGWVGRRCESIPKDHTEVRTAGYGEWHRGYLDMRAYGGGVVPITFFIASNGAYHNIQVLWQTGSMDFNRSWDDYRTGFVGEGYDQWTGFDTWRTITKMGYTKWYAVIAFKTIGVISRSHFDFSISDAADDFEISFSAGLNYARGSIASVTSFGDCLGPYQNVPFSTVDRDMDGVPGINCAAVVGSGWWYDGSCDKTCNLFGLGPSHWSTAPPNQRLSTPELDARYVTVEEFGDVHIYVEA